MSLDKNAVKEFCKIFERDYGKNLSLEEGKLAAERLLEFLTMISTLPDIMAEIERKYE